MKIDVFTDGSATVATKPGGWAFVLVIDEVPAIEGFGHMELASNNDAELEAAIQGLAAAFKYIHTPTNVRTDAIRDFPNVTLCSDSQIVLGWANGTYRFKQAAKMIKFDTLKELVRRMGVKTRWIKGHDGNEYNERCDKLANLGRKGLEKEKQAEAEISANTKIGPKKDGVSAFWYHGTLKIVDFSTNCVENYNKEVHGKRDSKIEIR